MSAYTDLPLDEMLRTLNEVYGGSLGGDDASKGVDEFTPAAPASG